MIPFYPAKSLYPSWLCDRFPKFFNYLYAQNYASYIRKLRRYLRNPKNRRIIFALILIMSVIFYILFAKIPYEKSIKAVAVESQISSVLGTRITAVRLLPDKNTTRIQPSLECQVIHFNNSEKKTF